MVDPFVIPLDDRWRRLAVMWCRVHSVFGVGEDFAQGRFAFVDSWADFAPCMSAGHARAEQSLTPFRTAPLCTYNNAPACGNIQHDTAVRSRARDGLAFISAGQSP